MVNAGKSITTLVKDIYGLFSKPGPVASEAQVDELGRALTDMLKRRLSVTPEPRGLSMSSLGTQCKRQLWYKINKPELAEPLDPKARLNFLAGDIWEEILLFLAKVSGHRVEGEQDELNLYGIKGHRDAVIDGVTVDVKTANSRSIEKFRNHDLENDDPFGYISQLSCYVTAAADDPLVQVRSQGSFLVADKERGGLTLDTYRLAPVTEVEVDKVKAIVAADEPPARRYSPVLDGKSGNLVLPFQCAYCSHKKECWKDSNKGSGLRKFIYSTGPRWFTSVFREPDVPEVKE